jgi:hypothetical protein
MSSGAAWRQYLSVSQNRPWQPMACRGRRRRPLKGRPRWADSSWRWSAIRSPTSAGVWPPGSSKHFLMPPNAPGLGWVKSLSLMSISVQWGAGDESAGH